MSRVDDAFAIWERKTGRSPRRRSVQDEGDSQSFALNGYAREGSHGRAAAEAGTPGGAQPHKSVGEASMAVVRPAARTIVARILDERGAARLVGERMASVPVEQYRRLASVLHDVQQQQGLKTLMVASALPGEGKTLTTVNLALTLSESYGRRVLIVDADLRRPGVHAALGIRNDAGFGDLLREQVDDVPILQVSPRLSVLTAGRPGPAPLANLTSARMTAFLEDAAKSFDWVLLDTPPVNLLPDGALLARMTRAVVFVIAAGKTPSAAVERAVSELGGDVIIGTVLNRVEAHRIPAAGYSEYYAD